jgi:hypothetical protein
MSCGPDHFTVRQPKNDSMAICGVEKAFWRLS